MILAPKKSIKDLASEELSTDLIKFCYKPVNEDLYTPQFTREDVDFYKKNYIGRD